MFARRAISPDFSYSKDTYSYFVALMLDFISNHVLIGTCEKIYHAYSFENKVDKTNRRNFSSHLL